MTLINQEKRKFECWSLCIRNLIHWSLLFLIIHDILIVLSYFSYLNMYACIIHLLLGIKKSNPSVQSAWNTAKSVTEHSDFSQFPNDPKSPWPFFMFVGLVIGAPWLMFRLLARSVAKKPFGMFFS